MRQVFISLNTLPALPLYLFALLAALVSMMAIAFPVVGLTTGDVLGMMM